MARASMAHVAGSIAEQIERDKRKEGKPPSVPPSVHKNLLCSPVICLECGQVLNILTHCHAEKHGYANKQELIAAGKVKLI